MGGAKVLLQSATCASDQIYELFLDPSQNRKRTNGPHIFRNRSIANINIG